MSKYQVSIIERSREWQPESLDDAPAQPGKPLEVLCEHDGLFAAVRRAIEYNQADQRKADQRWAVVVEPGALGSIWRNARLCTPLSYKVTGIWWPDGWEPASPLDVPNCVWRAQGELNEQRTSYPQAVATVRGLNQQSMDRLSPLWYVVVAVENEPISQTLSYDPAGTETTVQVRRLHVVRPEEGGRGDCSHCPASSLQCAREDWISLEQTAQLTQTRCR
ncbi:MAG: hypothetical protein HUU20_13425 [Pirellulales bacterium]|nr:hypothetical protein [Pirellulales bacterium]